MSDFHDIVDTHGLSPEEEARLRRVHELLVEAGPPPELPPALREPPSTRQAEVIPFPRFPPRRFGAVAVIAAAAVIAAFAIGYFLGHSKARPATFDAMHVVVLHATRPSSGALAVLKVARSDSVGNWPMRLQVTGLPRQASRTAYYELWLTRGGRPVEPCGTFRVHGQTTTVSLSVPYEFRHHDGWVVTAQPHGDATPGRVVLTT
jgi:hypothetical protein